MAQDGIGKVESGNTTQNKSPMYGTGLGKVDAACGACNIKGLKDTKKSSHMKNHKSGGTGMYR